jgi:hypothetical protein
MLTTCLKYDSCRLPASLCNSKCKEKEMPTTFKNLPTTLKKEKIGRYRETPLAGRYDD